jgi:predicted nucleic acid-binding protein
MRFFDTNILVYAATNQDERKSRIARDVVAHSIKVNHDGCISTQVLSEFANVMMGKLHHDRESVDGFLDYFRELVASDVTIDIVRRAVEVKEEYGIQFYDALIVATAFKLNCLEIVSEDLNPGQTYCGMAVVNPFLQGDN